LLYASVTDTEPSELKVVVTVRLTGAPHVSTTVLPTNVIVQVCPFVYDSVIDPLLLSVVVEAVASMTPLARSALTRSGGVAITDLDVTDRY
jgi:hypothetical protein